MSNETLDQIIERMTKECKKESKKTNSSSCDTEEVVKIEKYVRTSTNKNDDDNR